MGEAGKLLSSLDSFLFRTGFWGKKKRRMAVVSAEAGKIACLY
jgi:hypothetical protein